MAGALAVTVVVLGLFVAAVWPPASAPEGWRRVTRPLRRRLRPRHYGDYP